MEQNGLDISTINPNNGDRYSPNLYRWLNHKSYKHRAWTSRVYTDKGGVMWIGMINDPGPCFSGARLMAVLCNGGREQTFAYLKKKFISELTEISDFWEQYAAKGRCAIDPQHEKYFMNNDTRWQYDGHHRYCLWCSEFTQVLKKWKETVDREKWVELPIKSMESVKKCAVV